MITILFIGIGGSRGRLRTAHAALRMQPLSRQDQRDQPAVLAALHSSAFGHGEIPHYSRISPCLMPRVTASVRLEALSLAKMEPT